MYIKLNILPYQKIIPNIHHLISICRSANIPIFYTQAIRDPSGIDLLIHTTITGNYTSFEEFNENIKDTLGITADSRAIEAYTQFSTIIYDSEILNTIINISGTTEDIKTNGHNG